MNLKYKVHRSSTHYTDTKLELADGTTVVAPVLMRVVELVPVGMHPDCGTIQLVINDNQWRGDVGDEMEVSINLGGA